MSVKPSTRSQAKTTTNADGNPRRLLWAGVAVAVVIFVVVAVLIWQRTSFPFTFVGGEERAIVILRNTQDIEYEIKFTGNQPVELNRVIIQLESQQMVLFVEVQQVTAIVGGQEVVLDDAGRVPEGTQLLVQPDDVIKVRVTYYGDSIGAHYVYGFRLGFTSNGVENENTLNIKDREFIVSVE
jgi:hypothetical protein